MFECFNRHMQEVGTVLGRESLCLLTSALESNALLTDKHKLSCEWC